MCETTHVELPLGFLLYSSVLLGRGKVTHASKIDEAHVPQKQPALIRSIELH